MESKDMHKANAYVAGLAEERGPAYAAVIQVAANLHRTLSVVTAGGFDRMYVGHVEGRYRGLLQLEGMTAAAVAIMTETGAMKHNPAQTQVQEDIGLLSALMTQDIDAVAAARAR